jgi:hypothetical protein
MIGRANMRLKQRETRFTVSSHGVPTPVRFDLDIEKCFVEQIYEFSARNVF